MSSIAKRKEALGASLSKVNSRMHAAAEAVEAGHRNTQSSAAAVSQWAGAMQSLVSRSADVCNDMLATRDADPWSTAFVYVVNYCLANLACARAASTEDVAAGMVANLALMADELYDAFPSGKRVVTDWRIAVGEVRKLLPSSAPGTLPEVHPFAGTLGRQLSILRNRGYPMAGLTEFYAPSDSGLHVVRPT
jgi:hypothetical protein